MLVLVSFAFGMPSSSQSSSRTSQRPSPLRSTGMSVSLSESVPQAISSRSSQPSSSSSRSSMRAGSLVEFTPGTKSSGLPSPSVSLEADGSSGKASGPAVQLLVTGDSGPSQTPSPSVSGLSGSVPIGRPVSLRLSIPSPSMSRSSPSQIASPSMSSGIEVAFFESELQASSEISG